MESVTIHLAERRKIKFTQQQQHRIFPKWFCIHAIDTHTHMYTYIRLLSVYCNGTELPYLTCMITTMVQARSTEKRTNLLTRPPNFCQRLVRKEQLTAMANLSMLADRLLGGRSRYAHCLPLRARLLSPVCRPSKQLRLSPTAKEASHCQIWSLEC
jgi:hypothetical protein